MFSISKLAVLLPVLSAAFASPLAQLESRQWQCKPNFQGNAVSIFVVDPTDYTNDKIYEWYAQNYYGAPITLRSQYAAQSLQQGEFFIEFTGQPEQTHRIKLTADTSRDLIATVTSSNELVFSKTLWGDKSQDFSIDCDRCLDNGSAAYCRVSHPTSGQCVNYAPGPLEGQRLALGPCSSAGTFHMLPQLSAADAAAVRAANFL